MWNECLKFLCFNKAKDIWNTYTEAFLRVRTLLEQQLNILMFLQTFFKQMDCLNEQ